MYNYAIHGQKEATYCGSPIFFFNHNQALVCMLILDSSILIFTGKIRH